MRSIETVLTHLANAVEEGKRGRVVRPAAEEGGAGPKRRSTRAPAARPAREAQEKPAPPEQPKPPEPPEPPSDPAAGITAMHEPSP